MEPFQVKEARLFENSLETLEGGDVLLCTGKAGDKKDPMGGGIKAVTGSRYAHAAIYIGDYTVADSVTKTGVRRIGLTEFVGEYLHCVVLRRSEAWPPSSKKILNDFVEKLISSNTKYDYIGALQLALSLLTNTELSGKIRDLLALQTNDGVQKQGMFCSQLVAACFIVTGYIDESAKHLFVPEETPPIKLAVDKAYGDFLGYIWLDADHTIPEDDELYHWMV